MTALAVLMFGEHETDAVNVPPGVAPLVSIPTNQPVPCDFEEEMAPSESVSKPPLTATIPAGQVAMTESKPSIGAGLDALTETSR